MDRGMLFSMDALITSMVVLLLAGSAITVINANVSLHQQSMQEEMRELHAFVFSESLIKTRQGLASYDPEKKRTHFNVITKQAIAEKEFPSLKLLTIETQGVTQTLFEQQQEKECIIIERLAWMRETYSPVIVKGVFCE
jgi:hypothetical protein